MIKLDLSFLFVSLKIIFVNIILILLLNKVFKIKMIYAVISVIVIIDIVPMATYLIFYNKDVNSFITLPTITKTIPDVKPEWTSLNGEKVTLDNKITILGFTGQDIMPNSGNFFTLNQKIYNKYREFKDFQMVFIAPNGTQQQAETLLKELGKIANVSGYHFVFASPDAIAAYHKELKLLGKLDEKAGTPNVYIIDKKRNLRGRKGKSVQGEPEYKEGYNTTSASDLHNDMMDDVKIILAEYRLALKRNSADRKI